MAGAGFVVFRVFPDGIKFLGLVGPEFHRNRCQGTYDIPKGVIDLGESALQTAKREAYEEAGYLITDNSIVAGPFKDSYLTIWIAQVYHNPVLSKNPHTGILEHEGHAWMDPDELLGDCYDYLKPTVQWACKYIEDLK